MCKLNSYITPFLLVITLASCGVFSPVSYVAEDVIAVSQSENCVNLSFENHNFIEILR